MLEKYTEVYLTKEEQVQGIARSSGGTAEARRPEEVNGASPRRQKGQLTINRELPNGWG